MVMDLIDGGKGDQINLSPTVLYEVGIQILEYCNLKIIIGSLSVSKHTQSFRTVTINQYQTQCLLAFLSMA